MSKQHQPQKCWSKNLF